MNRGQQSNELHEQLEIIIGLLAEILHQAYEHRVGNHDAGAAAFVLPRAKNLIADPHNDDSDIPF